MNIDAKQIIVLLWHSEEYSEYEKIKKKRYISFQENKNSFGIDDISLEITVHRKYRVKLTRRKR